MPPASEDRRTEIADTIIGVLAAAGARGLTHRAVDEAAGLPAGSSSYYFRTREALLIAAARRLAELDLAGGTAVRRAPGTVEELVRLLGRLVRAQVTTHRGRTLARYQLSLDAARYPAVRSVLEELSADFVRAAIGLLTGLGTGSPERDARALIALCSGIVFESTIGGQRPYPPAEIRRMLTDLLTARLNP